MCGESVGERERERERARESERECVCVCLSLFLTHSHSHSHYLCVSLWLSLCARLCVNTCKKRVGMGDCGCIRLWIGAALHYCVRLVGYSYVTFDMPPIPPHTIVRMRSATECGCLNTRIVPRGPQNMDAIANIPPPDTSMAVTTAGSILLVVLSVKHHAQIALYTMGKMLPAWIATHSRLAIFLPSGELHEHAGGRMRRHQTICCCFFIKI